jgi:haloacid dehalogenase-like hydrolase
VVDLSPITGLSHETQSAGVLEQQRGALIMGQLPFDPLPSWNEGAAKHAILEFVARATADGPDFVPPQERIAVFDNDGTLWSEMPVPVQAFFTDQRLRSHSGMTADEFDLIVRDWLKTARNPKLGRLFIETAYQPMLEVLRFLRAEGFSTYIVSGGGVEFMRIFADEVYGIPPEQVVGDPVLDFFNDRAGKPVVIKKYIGRRPIACFGNSDGDREMLKWTTLGRPDKRRGFGMIVHHTDADREFKYDREHVLSGRLDQGLDEAPTHGWVCASMKSDWRTVFA